MKKHPRPVVPEWIDARAFVQRCLDWQHDTGSCPFCPFVGPPLPRAWPHAADCAFVRYGLLPLLPEPPEELPEGLYTEPEWIEK